MCNIVVCYCQNLPSLKKYIKAEEAPEQKSDMVMRVSFPRSITTDWPIRAEQALRKEEFEESKSLIEPFQRMKKIGDAAVYIMYTFKCFFFTLDASKMSKNKIRSL